MQPLGVHHVSLTVRNVDEALTFYVEILGLSPRSDRPSLPFEGAWLDVGNQQVHLIAGEPPPNHGQHFALWVPDLAGVVAELRGRGLEVTEPSPIGTSRQAFVIDPSGNRVELHETAGNG